MQRLAIGIDIGGQSSKCGVVTQDGTILCQSVVTSLIDSFDNYLELLVTTIKDLIRQTASKGTPAGIGIGAPNANRLDGTIRYAPNLRWARDSDGKPGVIHLAQRLEAATGHPSNKMMMMFGCWVFNKVSQPTLRVSYHVAMSF